MTHFNLQDDIHDRTASRDVGLAIIERLVAMGAEHKAPLDFLHNMLVLHFRLRSKVKVASASISVNEIERMFANAFPYSKYVVPFRRRTSDWILCVRLMARYDNVACGYVSLERFDAIVEEIGKFHAAWQNLVAVSEELAEANASNEYAAAV